MELKKYQRRALEDLARYLDAYANSRGDLRRAWQEYWEFDAPEKYHDRNLCAPEVCMKVPTGGGKTFMACAALAEIFMRLPRIMKLVIWLVPSDAILAQTVAALTNLSHPYRARLNMDFGGRVAVYTKEMLLQGQNFSPAVVSENLAVCVMSYASSRIDSRKKDTRKVYQENGALLSFADYFGTAGTSLIEILREMRPVVIVDESHRAKSELSAEMLANFSPSFILELTATPKSTSNVIASVSARELKAENMVKLPVIINPPQNADFFIAAFVEQRNNLERLAVEGGRYIRPIVLLQAESDTGDDSKTFGKIKAELIDAGIPAEQIAIKTANINELKGVDLLSESCAIRYIITVNALQEGWDCPFAYILVSWANKNSDTDVAQIVGRILRQPYAAPAAHENLNMAYVYSRSANFTHTVESVVKGLEGDGFTKNECRAPEGYTLPAIEKGGDSGEIETESFGIKPQFEGEIGALKIPQFFLKVKRSAQLMPDIFETGEYDAELLSAENLSTGFSLARADAEIIFDIVDVRKVDVDERGEVVVGGISTKELADYQRRYIDTKTPEERADFYTRSIFHILSRFNRARTYGAGDLLNYIRRVVDGMSELERGGLNLETVYAYADQIRKKIARLETLHRRKIFGEFLGAQKIFCKGHYALKNFIDVRRPRRNMEKSLYAAEGDMNNFEMNLIVRIAAIENVTWWHRNIERQGFYLNGWLNHYPDFIVRTDSGKIILVEAKGGHLDGDDSREKLNLGNEWQARAGENFGYFMVFDENPLDGQNSYAMNKFLGVIREL